MVHLCPSLLIHAHASFELCCEAWVAGLCALWRCVTERVVPIEERLLRCCRLSAGPYRSRILVALARYMWIHICICVYTHPRVHTHALQVAGHTVPTQGRG